MVGSNVCGDSVVVLGGGLEGDLKEKMVSERREGWQGWNFGVEELEKDVVEKKGWGKDEDPEELWVEGSTVSNKDERNVITFVE